jgi:hypothetical protein
MEYWSVGKDIDFQHYSNTPSLQYSNALIFNISQIKRLIQLTDQA